MVSEPRVSLDSLLLVLNLVFLIECVALTTEFFVAERKEHTTVCKADD
jgi:hypothetical protein